MAELVTADNGEQVAARAGGFGDYRKKQPTRAVRMSEPFVCDTGHGPARGEAGDWLAVDGRGLPYPVEADEFDRTYEPCMWALWFDEQPVSFTRDADSFRAERGAVGRLARSDQERFRFGPWEGEFPLPVEQQASSERMVACFRTLAKDAQYAEWMRRAVDGGYASSEFALALSDA